MPEHFPTRIPPDVDLGVHEETIVNADGTIGGTKRRRHVMCVVAPIQLPEVLADLRRKVYGHEAPEQYTAEQNRRFLADVACATANAAHHCETEVRAARAPAAEPRGAPAENVLPFPERRYDIEIGIQDVDETFLATLRRVPPSLRLTFAVNALRVAWKRHEGGALADADRIAIVGAMLMLERCLAEPLPKQAARIDHPQRCRPD